MKVYTFNSSGPASIDTTVEQAFPSGARLAYNDGKPTTGYWKKGDIIFDVAGSLRFCTVAGAPGTWVAAAGA